MTPSTANNLTPSAVLEVMRHHIGKAQGIGIAGIVQAVTQSSSTAGAERQCRRIISDLREEGVAICGKPATGYYIAANQAELEECCRFLRSRALTSLRLESRLRKMALPDLIQQLRITI
jgi:hypothetical protein